MSLDTVNGNLELDGANLVELADRFGTPLYAYGADSIRSAYQQLRAALPDPVRIHYSVKANPSLAVCALLQRLGANAEVASAGELAVAVAAGFSADRILFAGPGKTNAELSEAIRLRIGSIHAESLGELERIAELAGTAGVEQPVCLRINLGEASPSGARIAMGGAQKFGIDADRCAPAIEAARGASSLRLDGFHFFEGSQFSHHEALLDVFDASVNTARRLCEAHDLSPRIIDLGGGIGVSHSGEEPRFDIQAFGAGLAKRLRVWAEDACFQGTRFVVEPGRALVSAAGVYLARVLDVKVTGDHMFGIVDGGIHHALLPITSNEYRVVLASQAEPESDSGQQDVLLGGPLCTPADQWHSGATLPRVSVGDVIAVLNSGAYGLSASMTLFLSHGVPAEVLVEGGVPRLIRRRGTPGDLLRDQLMPESTS